MIQLNNKTILDYNEMEIIEQIESAGQDVNHKQHINMSKPTIILAFAICMLATLLNLCKEGC